MRLRASLLFSVVILLAPVAVETAYAQKPKDKSTVVKSDKTDMVQAGDRLWIELRDALPGAPIKGAYQVEVSGKVALGPAYGRVQLEGLPLEKAEAAVREHLARIVKDPQVMVTRHEPLTSHPFTLEVGKYYQIVLPNHKSYPGDATPVLAVKNFSNGWVQVKTEQGQLSWINLNHAMQVYVLFKTEKADKKQK